MIVYQFRITSEEYDDFLRVIEIQPGQTFLDFHEIIMGSSEIEKCDKAFFYLTDNTYRKQKEISLKPLKKQVRKYDDEMDEIITEEQVPRLMKEARLKDYVEDPHQRMIYEFHGKDFLVFFIELFRIVKTEEKLSLPRCVQSKGEIPKKLDIAAVPMMAPPEEEAPIHPPLQASGGSSLFSNIQEDETEIAEIENRLNDLIANSETEVAEEPAESGQEEVIYSMHQEDDPDEKDRDQIESLDEYEDIESLEMNQRDFDRDSDDF